MKTNLMALILLFGIGIFSVALSQEEDKPAKDKDPKKVEKKSDDKKDDAKKSDKKKEPEKKAEPENPVLAIVGGDIHTVTGPVIRGGTVLIQDGKILDVGQNVTIPEGAKEIDATGKILSPGFIAITMSRVGIGSTPSGSNKLADSVNAFDRNIKYSLGVGITTGCIELSTGRSSRRRRRNGAPEERFLGLQNKFEEFANQAERDFGTQDTDLCPCCGLPILPTEPVVPARPTAAQPRKHAVLKMSYGKSENMVVSENVFYSPSPGALNGALNRHNWRVNINKVKKYLADQKAEAEKKATAAKTSSTSKSKTGSSSTKKSGPSRRAPSVDQALLRLVKKETYLRVSANTVDVIRDMIALAEELDYNLCIEGGVEAWVVAGELGQAKVPVIYTPRRQRRAVKGNESKSGSNIESTGIFQRAGVPFVTNALSSSISLGGLAGRDLSSLPLEAAFAVRGGATNQKALESLTIEAAKLLGLQDRIGSIEKGKDADILILNGPPLDYRTYVETAIVQGNVSYERAKDKILPVFER